MLKQAFKMSALALFLVVILSGCSFPWEKNKKESITPNNANNNEPARENNIATKTNEIRKFKNEDELKIFLQNNSNNRGMTSNYNLPSAVVMKSGMASGKSTDTSFAASTQGLAASGSSDYSTSNNQVFGVDEADIIKTDGKYIYAVVGNKLMIIEAMPAAESKIISEITFKSAPIDLFVSEGRLAIFGNDYNIEEKLDNPLHYGGNFVFFKVFDISNPAEPKETRSLDFEGNYTSARMIGNYIYFITNKYAYYVEGEPLTPKIIEGTKTISGGCKAEVAGCFVPDVYYFDSSYDNYNFTSVNSININDKDESVKGQIYLINSGENVYVSASNIYLTSTEYLSEYELEQEVARNLIFSKLQTGDQDKIKQIEAAPNFILNAEEKRMKVSFIIQSYLSSLGESEVAALKTEEESLLLAKIKEKSKEMEKTVIHKISIKAGKAEYLAKGEVQGRLLNQFSMDEHDGYLRLATTRNEMWSRLFKESQKSYSNVYVLDENLKLSGSLENLATDEKIYSARFMGDRAYIVTFKRTDPLYVIDLSDKAKPSVLGALKIPGFSSYLHPIDDKGTKLLGFGRDTEEIEGGGVKVKGLKLSLFDFTDLSKPKELSSYVIGNENSYSEALNDHLAFLYSSEKNIISIPATLSDNDKLAFSGSLIFSIEKDLLKLKGKVNHLPAAVASQSDYLQYYLYSNVVKRSLFIENNLFTFSNKFLKVNNINDLSDIKSLILTPGAEDYIITPMPTSPEQPVSGRSEASASSSEAVSGAAPAAPNVASTSTPSSTSAMPTN